MLKRLLALVAVVGTLSVAGCCGTCGGGSGGSLLHCESPCYASNWHRDANHMMDFVDVYFLNYDKHNPYRCDPCAGN